MSFNKRIYGTWEKVKLSNLIHHLSTTSVPEEALLKNHLKGSRRISLQNVDGRCIQRPWTVSGNCRKQYSNSANDQLLTSKNTLSSHSKRAIGDCKLSNAASAGTQKDVKTVEPSPKKLVNRNQNRVWSTKSSLETADEGTAKNLKRRASKSNESLNLKNNNNEKSLQSVIKEHKTKSVNSNDDGPVKRFKSIPAIQHKIEAKPNGAQLKQPSLENKKAKNIQNYNQNVKDLIHTSSCSRNSPLTKQQENTKNKSYVENVEFYKSSQKAGYLNKINNSSEIKEENKEIQNIKNPQHTSTQNVDNNKHLSSEKSTVLSNKQHYNAMKTVGSPKMRSNVNEKPIVHNIESNVNPKGVLQELSKKDNNFIWPPLYAAKTVHKSNPEQQFISNLKQKIEKVSNNIELKKKTVDHAFSMGRVFNVAHISNSIIKPPGKPKSYKQFSTHINESKNNIQFTKNVDSEIKVSSQKQKFSMTSPPQIEKALPLRKLQKQSLVSNANSVVSNPKFFAIQEFMEENRSKLKSSIKKFIDEKKKELTTDLKDEIQEWKKSASIKKRIEETKTKIRKQIVEKSNDIRIHQMQKKSAVMKKKNSSKTTAISLANVLFLNNDPILSDQKPKAQSIINEETKPDSLDATNVLLKKYNKTLLKNKHSNHTRMTFKDFVKEKEMIRIKEKFDQAVIPVMQRNLELEITLQCKNEENKLNNVNTSKCCSYSELKPSSDRSNDQNSVKITTNVDPPKNSPNKQKQILDIPVTAKKHLLKSVSGNLGNSNSETKSSYTSYPSGYLKKPELIIENCLDIENRRNEYPNKHLHCSEFLSSSKNSINNSKNSDLISSSKVEITPLPDKESYSDQLNHSTKSNPGLEATLENVINNSNQNELINNASIQNKCECAVRSNMVYGINSNKFRKSKQKEEKKDELELNQEGTRNHEHSINNTSLNKEMSNTQNCCISPLDGVQKFHFVSESSNKTPDKEEENALNDNGSCHDEKSTNNNNIFSSKEEHPNSINQGIDSTNVTNYTKGSTLEDNTLKCNKIEETLNESAGSNSAQKITKLKKIVKPEIETVMHDSQDKDSICSKNSDPVAYNTISTSTIKENLVEKEALHSAHALPKTEGKKESFPIEIDNTLKTNEVKYISGKIKMEVSSFHNFVLKLFNDWPKLQRLIKLNNASSQSFDATNVQKTSENTVPSSQLAGNVSLKPHTPFMEYRRTSKSSINGNQLCQKDTPEKLRILEFFQDIYNYIKNSKLMFFPDFKSSHLTPTNGLGTKTCAETIEKSVESSNIKNGVVQKKTIKIETITDERRVPKNNVELENNLKHIRKGKLNECTETDQNKKEHDLKISDPNLDISPSKIVLSRQTKNVIKEEHETIKTFNGDENQERKEASVETLKSSSKMAWPNLQASSGLHTMPKKESEARGIAGYLWDQIFQKRPRNDELRFVPSNVPPVNFGLTSTSAGEKEVIADIGSNSTYRIISQNLCSKSQIEKLKEVNKSCSSKELYSESKILEKNDSSRLLTNQNSEELLDSSEFITTKHDSLLKSLKKLCSQYERNFFHPKAELFSESGEIDVSQANYPKREPGKVINTDSIYTKPFSLKKKRKEVFSGEKSQVIFNKKKTTIKRKKPVVHMTKISPPRKRRINSKLIQLKNVPLRKRKHNSFLSEMLNPRDGFLSILQWEVKRNDKHLENPEVFWNENNQEYHSGDIMNYIKNRK